MIDAGSVIVLIIIEEVLDGKIGVLVVGLEPGLSQDVECARVGAEDENLKVIKILISKQRNKNVRQEEHT